MSIQINDVKDEKVKALLTEAYSRDLLGVYETVSETLLRIVEYLATQAEEGKPRPTYKNVREWAKTNDVTDNVSQSVIKTAMQICYHKKQAVKVKKSVPIIEYAIGRRFVTPLIEMSQEQLGGSNELDKLINDAWLRVIIPLVRYTIEMEKSMTIPTFDFQKTPLTIAELTCTLLEDEDAYFSAHMCQKIIQKKVNLIISYDSIHRVQTVIDDIRATNQLTMDMDVFAKVRHWLIDYVVPVIKATKNEGVSLPSMRDAANYLSSKLVVEIIKNTIYVL